MSCRRVKTTNFEVVERVPLNKSLPEGCIHSRPLIVWSAAMAMADGCVTHEVANIAQHNQSFNVVWAEKVGKYFGKLTCTAFKVGPSTYEGMMVYLLSIGLHFSHRKEQVVVAICYHLFFHEVNLGLDTKFDDLDILANGAAMSAALW